MVGHNTNYLLPSKADRGLPKLVSQRRRDGDAFYSAPPSPPQQPRSMSHARPKQPQPQPRRPSFSGRRASIDTMVDILQDIVKPLPVAPQSSPASHLPPRRDSRAATPRLAVDDRQTGSYSLSPDFGNTARHSGQRRSFTSYPVERLRSSSPFARAVSPARSFDLSDRHTNAEQQREIPRKPVGSPRSFNIGSIRTFRSKSEPAVLPYPPTPALAPIPSRASTIEEEKRATKVAPLVRSGSVTKNKGKKNRHNKKPSFKKMDKESSRWTFTDNITDLLTGKLFKKIEVDEMVTPEQVNAYKRRREEKAASQQERESAEASETIPGIKNEDPDSPNEPFHLEDLAKRIGASSVVASPRRDSPLKQELTHDVVRRDFSAWRNPTPEEDGVSPLTPEESSSSAPNPPAKNPARYNNTDSQAQMPTIPELLVTTPEEDDTDKDDVKLPIHGNTPTAESLDDPFEDDDFVFFKSNPCTFTMPGIRHGPIRIAKSGLDLKFDTENTLDWTAFQMAILGGAGDFFYGSPDLTPQYSEEEEIADLKEWLGELGFSRIGALVPAQPGERPEGSDESTSSTSPISASSSCYDDDEEDDDEDYTDLPIPVALDYPTGFWNEGKPDTSKFSTGGGCQIKRWTIEGHPRKYKRSSCESNTSLSRHPMMPFDADGAPAELDAGNNADVVSMGSNLVHDLGDFLRWEAEFCSAADF